MKRSFHLFAVLLVAVAGTGLFVLKYKVEEKDRELQQLYSQIEADQRAIRVLRAEWAYLNSPDYLQKMAAEHLGLKPVSSVQILTGVEALPWRIDGAPIASPPVDVVKPVRRAPVTSLSLGRQGGGTNHAGRIRFDAETALPSANGGETDVLRLLSVLEDDSQKGDRR